MARCVVGAAECLKRWRSLRDRYRRERVKEKEAQRSGAGADKQPVWRYMAVMGFLAPFLQNRGTTSNLPHRNPSPVSVMVVIEEDGEAGALAADEAAPAPAPATAPAADGRSQWLVQPPEEGRGRKRRRPEMSSFEQGMLAYMEPLATLASQPQPQPQPQPPSEDEAFFMSLLPAMRRLSSANRAMVRYEVYHIVSRADMAGLQGEVRENVSD
ncbi:unnamed protein product [Boreogadus saida]